MEEYVIKELEYYSEILEAHFRDMVDIEFTMENGEIYILAARKCTDLLNLKIIISMFCEGKMSVSDVFRKVSYQQIVNFLDTEKLVNSHELKFLAKGVSASGGVGIATVCYSAFEAEDFIARKEEFILCRMELSPNEIEIVNSKYCKGVITERGGMTSHAAVICRRVHKPCVSGVNNFIKIKKCLENFDNKATIDGNKGEVFAGVGKSEKNNPNTEEVKILYELLLIVIKYNIIAPETPPLIWRIWDVIVLSKRYESVNTKKMVANKSGQYISFKQPDKKEINNIYSDLQCVKNGNLLVEDLIGFLFDELSAQVAIGSHYRYMRPLLNPIDAINYNESSVDTKWAGIQLTGVEFFHINRFIDFLLDIYSIKIYFCTKIFKCDLTDKSDDDIYTVKLS